MPQCIYLDENKSSLQTDPTISKAASSNVEESKQTETPVNHAIELEKVTNKPTKEKDKKSGNESDEDPELTRYCSSTPDYMLISYSILDYMLLSYSILCLHIICVIHVTHIKLYSQTVSFSSRQA